MLPILIGYIFIHFHFNINNFDLLPDFIGFILVFVGLGRLQGESWAFEKGKPWALGLAIVRFIFLFSLPFPTLVYHVITFLALCASIYLLYLVCIGVRELEQSRELELSSHKMLTVWKVYAVCNLAAALLTILLAELLVVVILILGVVAMVAIIILLVHLYRCHKTLQQSSPASEPPTWNA